MAAAPKTVVEAVIFLFDSRGVVVKKSLLKSQPLFFTPVNLLHGKVSSDQPIAQRPRLWA